MSRGVILRGGLTLCVLLLAFRTTAATDATIVTLYQEPHCTTCDAWAKHIRANGLEVVIQPIGDPSVIRRKLHVPERLASCHTAAVAGYAIEGDVPAHEIKRLLIERPDAAGLAVPGMPQGAPGLKTGRFEPYDVLLFDYLGAVRTYARYPH